MKNILDTIVRHKKKEVAASMKRASLESLQAKISALPKKRPQFLAWLKKDRDIAVIAEIKRRSPSKGLLRKGFDPVQIAREYQKAGASALSVLTDSAFFGGSLDILKKVRKATKLPILRKEFIIDAYQIYEARLAGADAILLIAAILTAAELKRFSQIAASLGLDVLFEAHTAGEVRKILKARPKLIGINNRNLKTFHVDLRTTVRLAVGVPKSVYLVAESGIRHREDLDFLKRGGARAVLVGETLMREKSPGAALRKLLGE